MESNTSPQVEYSLDNMTEGMKNLHHGYVDYAKEVILARALPSLLDGLKPANRRLMYTAYKTMVKNGKFIQDKSATLVGNTMKIHPHGDSATYESLVPMTENNGTMMIPVFGSQGNFGRYNSSAPPAASRYTEVYLSERARAYFGEMDGIKMIPTEDAKDVEPELLPVSFPAVLCNATAGIAVGFSSQIPSFNFNDVIDLTIEYLETGECKTVICPDFVSGGYYIKNNKELEKLMRIGSARLKLRGRIERDDRQLRIVEVPHSKTMQGIMKQLNDADIPSVRGSVGYLSDYDHGDSLLVECSSKNRVDETILAIYRDSDMQFTFNAKMMVVFNGIPVMKGVWGIIADWVEWRKGVLKKTYSIKLKKLEESRREARAFMTVIADNKNRDKIVDLVTHDSDEAAVQFILDTFDNEIIDKELANWIVHRSLSSFRKGGKYAEKYEAIENEIEGITKSIDNIEECIIAQLKALKAQYGHLHARRTEISTTDYEFVAADEEEAVKDTNICQFVLKDGFISKLRGTTPPSEYDLCVTAQACDTLIAVDNRGRVLRIYCEDLPYTNGAGLGTYLPRYLGIEETDDYRVWWMSVLDGTEKMILYSDGNVGFLNTAEWYGVDRKVKVIEKGIAVSVADKVAMVFDEVPESFFVTSNIGRVGFCITENVKHKNRTAKTRVFTLDADEYIDSYAAMPLVDASVYLTNPNYYAPPKLKFFESESSLVGDPNEFKPCY